MASPQTEDGFTRIANEIIEAIYKVNLSAYESRVMWFLFRKTYGFQKKTDRIALSQFAKEIGIDRRLVHRAIKNLSSKNMIVISKDDRNHVSYGFQKNYKKWNTLSLRSTVIHTDDKVSSGEMTEVSSIGIPTKESKETLTKDSLSEKKKSPKKSPPKPKKFLSDSEEYRLAEFFYKEILRNNPEHKKPNLDNWAKNFDLIIRVDKRKPRAIAEIIRWVQADNIPDNNNFCWAVNCLSPDKLRKQFDVLTMKKKTKDTQFKGTEDKRSYHKPLEELEEV